MLTILDPALENDALDYWLRNNPSCRDTTFLVLRNAWQAKTLEQHQCTLINTDQYTWPLSERHAAIDLLVRSAEALDTLEIGKVTRKWAGRSYQVHLGQLLTEQYMSWWQSLGVLHDLSMFNAEHPQLLRTDPLKIVSDRPAMATLMRRCLAYIRDSRSAAPTIVDSGIAVAEETFPSHSKRSTRFAFKDVVDVLTECRYQWRHRARRAVVVAHRQTYSLIEHLDSLVVQHRTLTGLQRITGTLMRKLGIGEERTTLHPDVKAQYLDVASPLQSATWQQHALDMAFDDMLARLSKALEDMKALWLVLSLLRPKLLVGIYWNGTFQHGLHVWGRTHHVPFAVIQHGFNIGAEHLIFTRTIDAEIFYTWRKGFGKEWVNRDRNPHVEIKGLGNPTIDAGPPSNPCINHPETRPVRVLIAPTAHFECLVDRWITFWEGVYSLMESPRYSHLTWTARAHAYSILQRSIKHDISQRGGTWSDLKTESIAACLQRHDLIITTMSSVCMDALIQGRLVVLWNTTGIATTEFYEREMACPVVRSFAELEDIMESLLSDDSTRAFWYERGRSFTKHYPTQEIHQRYHDDFLSRMTSTSPITT